MEKETITKFATVTICIVLTVVIITTALVPIISDATEEEEQTVEVSGAVGPNIEYNTQFYSETMKYWFRIVIDTDNELGNVLKFSHQASGTDFYYIYPIGDNFDNKTVILYSDDVITVYVVNGVITSTIEELYSGSTLPIISGDTDLGGWADKMLFRTISLPDYTLKYSRYDEQSSVVEYNARSLVGEDGRLTYVYQPNESGQYTTIEGNNPPSMDIPSVSVSGAYIGEKYETITTGGIPWSAVILAIPIIVLVSLLMVCVREFMGTRE